MRERTATIVVDLGYGDSGKGTVIDYLCARRQASLVVRFNGGSQAGHRVVAADGRAHVFAQFGAGLLVPGVETLLSRHMLVSPLAMLAEAAKLKEIGVGGAFARTVLSEEALVVTPFHRAANRLRERTRGDARHGSCGHGIGEAASHALEHPDEAIRLKDLASPDLLRRLRRVQERCRAACEDRIAALRRDPVIRDEIAHLEEQEVPERWLALLEPFLEQARIITEEDARRKLRAHENIAFEGAQGVLLDEWRGFHPYTTWSTCTFENALGLLAESGWDGPIVKTGVIRAYATRHGAGPFPTEDRHLTELLPDPANVHDEWQRGFRVGWLDLVAVRYAVAACGGIDALAMTCLDRLKPFEAWQVCDAYETPDGSMRDLSLGTFQDLTHQASLTAGLAWARPKFRVTTDQPDFRHKAIEHALAVSFLLKGPAASLLISTGPTCHDKTVIF